MFRSVFRPYGPVWNFLNNLTDALALSLLWCLCCLPLITVGAATTALYDAAVHGIRYREEGLYRRFFRTFRQNLKITILFTLLWGGILVFGAFVLSLLSFAAQESDQAAIMAGAYRVLMLIPLTALCWSCMLISRFEYGFRELAVNVIQFLIQHLLPSAAIGVITWLAIWLCGESLLCLLFLPAVTMIGWSLLSEPIFRRMGAGLDPLPKGEEAAPAET